MITRLCLFLVMSYYVWMITLMKKASNFQISKGQPEGDALHLLDFLLWPGVAYKSVAYEKTAVSQRITTIRC